MFIDGEALCLPKAWLLVEFIMGEDKSSHGAPGRRNAALRVPDAVISVTVHFYSFVYFFLLSVGFDPKAEWVPHAELNKLGQSVLSRELELWGPVAPVSGPVLFRHDSRLLSLELWPILARNLHRVVLRQFVFVVGALEEATLVGGRAGIQKKQGWMRKEAVKKGEREKKINWLHFVFC